MSTKSQPPARPRKLTAEARRRAEKLLREITQGVKIKKRMRDRLGMKDEEAAQECGDGIY
jgi:hypothetical protein